MGPFFSLNASLDSLQLVSNDFQSFIGFSLFQSFSDTKNDLQVAIKSISGLFSNNLETFIT